MLELEAALEEARFEDAPPPPPPISTEEEEEAEDTKRDPAIEEECVVRAAELVLRAAELALKTELEDIAPETIGVVAAVLVELSRVESMTLTTGTDVVPFTTEVEPLLAPLAGTGENELAIVGKLVLTTVLPRELVVLVVTPTVLLEVVGLKNEIMDCPEVRVVADPVGLIGPVRNPLPM